MKTLCWNCRGLGNSEAVQTLARFATLDDLDVVFISETRLFKHKVDGIDARLLSYSKSHIDVEIEVESVKTRFTGMYGSFDRLRKHLDWELMTGWKRNHNYHGF
ncbi:hypothetical protein V6N13_138081 [Hibiscus sabdariffa]